MVGVSRVHIKRRAGLRGVPKTEGKPGNCQRRERQDPRKGEKEKRKRVRQAAQLKQVGKKDGAAVANRREGDDVVCLRQGEGSKRNRTDMSLVLGRNCEPERASGGDLNSN